MTDRIRAAAKHLGTFSRRDLYHYIDDQDPVDAPGERSFRRAWQGLRRRRELVRIEREKYGLDSDRAPAADVRRRIYRAMHVKGVFCAADIVKLTEADQSYVSAVIRRLARTGDLELTGRTGKTNRFRVRHADKFYLEHVK